MTNKLISKTRGFVALLAFSVTTVSAATVGSSEPLAWRFAHPEAQILSGVDFRKLSATPDGKALRDQFAAALGAPLMEQAERLLLSSVVDSTGTRADILVLSGSFTLASLRKIAMKEGAKMVPHKGLEIAAPLAAKAGDPHLAWMAGPTGGTTVLIGTLPAIQAAAERSRAHVESLASVNPLFGRARELALHNPVWITSDSVPRGFGPQSLDRFMAGETQQLDSGQVEGFDLGVQIATSAALSMWVWASNEATAFLVLKQMGANGNGKDPFTLSALLPELKGGVDGKALVMGTPLASGKVAERVGPLLAAFGLPVDTKLAASAAPAAQIQLRPKVDANVPMTGVAMLSPAVAPASPIPPVVQKKLFVRIQGLEEGTKDIPYTIIP